MRNRPDGTLTSDIATPIFIRRLIYPNALISLLLISSDARVLWKSVLSAKLSKAVISKTKMGSSVNPESAEGTRETNRKALCASVMNTSE